MSTVINWVNKAISDRDWPKITIVCGSVAVVALITRQVFKKSQPKLTDEGARGLKKLKLLDIEKSIMTMMPAVTTITVFKTSKVPEDFLKAKMKELLRKNPWLCGRIYENSTDGNYIAHPESIDNEEDINRYVKEHFLTVMDFDLPEHLPYDEIVKLIEPYYVKKGNLCINKADELLFRVSLLKLKGRDEVALVVSLSHILGDGYTYYTLLNMLDCNTPVEHLLAERTLQYGDFMMQLIGIPSMLWYNNPMFIIGLLCCSIFRPQMKNIIIKINNNWIHNEKMKYLEKRKNSTDPTTPTFISTNDIITSWYSQQSKLSTILMSINARKRIPCFQLTMAGNYETALIYNQPIDYNTPEAIRKSLRTYRNVSGTLPDSFRTLLWNIGISTNWTTFYDQIDINSSGSSSGTDSSTNNTTITNITPATSSVTSNSDYVYHIPVTTAAELSVWREAMVVFKMDADTTAVLLSTRTITCDNIPTIIGQIIHTF